MQTQQRKVSTVVLEQQWLFYHPGDFLVMLLINQGCGWLSHLNLDGIRHIYHIKKQNVSHLNVTCKGGRKSNTSRVSGDLKGSVTWEHTSRSHLATQLSQKDTWLNCASFPVHQGIFIYMCVCVCPVIYKVCHPITVIVVPWRTPTLIWDEIHGNALSPPPAIVLPAGQPSVSYAATTAGSAVRWVERVRPDIPFIRVGVVGFAGKSGKR